MKTNPVSGIFIAFLSLAALFFLACPTSEEGGNLLTLEIDKDNDSLLTFDTLIVKVHSKDGSFTKEVFHGKLTDPKQVADIPLDPKVGKEYMVSIVGYKGGKVGVNKEVTVQSQGHFQSKDLSISPERPMDTIKIEPDLPEILVATDTALAEGDSLKLPILLRHPWKDSAALALKSPPAGAALDTTGLASGSALLTWKPDFSQGRNDPYALIFVYTFSGRKIEKTLTVKVLNTNQPPKFKAISAQKAKEKETVTFKVEATDLDPDTLTVSSANLPTGAQFTASTFTWTPQVGQAGSHFIKFKVTDGKAFDSLDVTITVGDLLPQPGRPLVKGKPLVNTTTPAWTWSSGGGGSGNFRYQLDAEDLSNARPTKDTSYTLPTPLGEGTYTLFVQESNAEGTWSLTGRYTIRIDTTPPSPPKISGSSSSPTNNPKPTWTWVAGNGNGARLFRYKMDNSNLSSGAVSTQATTFTSAQNLTEGLRTLYVQEQDSAGNWSAADSAGIVLDFTPPAPPKVTSPHAAITNTLKPMWTWTGGGGGSGAFRFSLDSAALPNASAAKASSFTPSTNLSDGAHTLFVQERDEAGNWSSVGKWKLNIDSTPPKPPKVVLENPSFPTTNRKPTWTWTSGGAGDTGIYFYVLDTIAGAQTKTTKTLFSPAADLSIGKHTLYVREQDRAGNLSEWAAVSVTISQWVQSGKLAFPFTFLTVGSTLFAGANDGVFVSTNAGESWAPRNTGVGTTSAFSLIMNEKKLLAGTASGFIASQDSGRTWTLSNSGIEGFSSYLVSALGTGLFAGGPKGIFFSPNNGVNWRFMGLRDTSVSEILVLGTEVYAATENGVFLSTDVGATWGAMNEGLPALRVTSLVAINSTLFAGTYGGGVFTSSNGGIYWVEVSSGLKDKRVNTLVAKETNLIAGTNDGVFLSRVRGENWIDISAGIPDRYVTRLAVHGNYLITSDMDRVWRFFLE